MAIGGLPLRCVFLAVPNNHLAAAGAEDNFGGYALFSLLIGPFPGLELAFHIHPRAFLKGLSGGSVCLNSVSVLISGTSAGFRLPRCAASQ